MTDGISQDVEQLYTVVKTEVMKISETGLRTARLLMNICRTTEINI